MSLSIFLMNGTLVKGLQLFAALSLLIALHEGGHFFFARLFKTRVEKFYLFFDFLFPFSGVMNFALWKKQKGDTEYGIGWFPLGGYVKIAGMVDESMDKEQMKLPPQPWEYRSKKAYQRLFIMLGGIIVNTLVAIILYMVIFGVYGEKYLLTSNAKYGIVVDSLGRSTGLRNGDIIKSVDGKPVERFDLMTKAIVYSKNQRGTIELVRDGRDTTINIIPGTVNKMSKRKGRLVGANYPAVVDSVFAGQIASKAGFMKGDSIVRINGEAAWLVSHVDEAKKANYGKPMTITVIRAGAPTDITVTLPKDSMLGMKYMDEERYLTYTTVKYNPIQAIGKGFTYAFEQFGEYVSQLGLIFKSPEIKVNESVGGIASFAGLFPPEFDMQSFLKLTALISVILAFMNLLPIPGLDGGYVIFLLWEMITRKQVSEKVMEVATTIGLVLLLALMVYANGLDLVKWIKGFGA